MPTNVRTVEFTCIAELEPASTAWRGLLSASMFSCPLHMDFALKAPARVICRSRHNLVSLGDTITYRDDSGLRGIDMVVDVEHLEPNSPFALVEVDEASSSRYASYNHL